MRQRLLTALVALPVLIAAVWLGAPWLTLLAVLAGAVALREAYRLLPPGVTGLPVLLGTAWAVSLILGAQSASGVQNFLSISAGILAVGAFISLLWFTAFYRGQRYPLAFGYLMLGPAYAGFLLAHGLVLREAGEGDLGRNWLLFALLATMATDTGAYLVGRTIGSRPMAPSISPNKTWEGAAGGFLGAVGVALVLSVVFNLETAWWQVAVIGATVGAVSQCGDLFESKLKRAASVKDAGSIIPGHGGVLDRLDSVLFALPAVYYLQAIF